jgi:hypothetical protein
MDGHQQMVNITKASHQESTMNIVDTPSAMPERRVYGLTATGDLRQDRARLQEEGRLC